MQPLLKSILLMLCGLVATACNAIPASAQVEVVREDVANFHCAAVTGPYSGGCEIHFGSIGGSGGRNEFSLTGHVFGIEAMASDCLVELEGRVSEAGSGYIYSASYGADISHNCTRTPCGLPWTIQIEEDFWEYIHMEFCAHPSSGSDNRCLVEARTDPAGFDEHDYRINLADVSGTTHLGASCELTSGELGTEDWPPDTNSPHEEIEIIH
jgi:hypothetical protein